jgi:hypothetical protein
MDVNPVLSSRVQFERQTCEIVVTTQTTSQGETAFRAAAFEVALGTQEELRVARDDSGAQYEVLGPVPSEVAERLIEMLELRYGPRLLRSQHDQT